MDTRMTKMFLMIMVLTAIGLSTPSVTITFPEQSANYDHIMIPAEVEFSGFAVAYSCNETFNDEIISVINVTGDGNVHSQLTAVEGFNEYSLVCDNGIYEDAIFSVTLPDESLTVIFGGVMFMIALVATLITKKN